MPRSTYYSHEHPDIRLIYDYERFWSDRTALQFYERLSNRQKSYVFADLYYHYVPVTGEVGIHDLCWGEEYQFQKEDDTYSIFPPEYNINFSQLIVNDFMARPTRKSPKRRSIRRLEHCYRQIAKAHPIS